MDDNVIQKVRAARVRDWAGRGFDPREHRDAASVGPDDMEDLLEVAANAAGRRGTASAQDRASVQRRRERRRTIAENRADAGTLRIGGGDFPYWEIGELFTDDGVRALLARQEQGAIRAAERIQAREEREAIEHEARAVAKEHEAKERAKIELEAKKRLGLAK
jgi:hypothetical protein